jgi:hypothetical protein
VEGAGGRLVCLHSGGGGVAYGVVEGPHDMTPSWQSSGLSLPSRARSSAC